MHATFAERQAIERADFFSPSKQVAHLKGKRGVSGEGKESLGGKDSLWRSF